jgi:glutamate synthase (NADPH/NADH) large chain
MMDAGLWHRGQTDDAQLKKLLEDHNRWTGSKRARELLDDWDVARRRFVKVFPIEYKRALGEMALRRASQGASAAPDRPPVVAATRARASGKKETVPAK